LKNAIISLAVWSTSLILCAQQSPRAASGGFADRFKHWDKNGDGKLGAAEFPGAQFKQMDKDGDGFVTADEVRTFFAGRRTARPAAEQTNQMTPRIVWQVSVGGESDVPGRGGFGQRGTGQMPRIVRGVSTDREGGVFFCGSFFGKCSVGGQERSSAGAADVLIGRLNGGGGVAWLKGFGARGTDIAPDIATDSRGNCAVTGMCSSETRFDSSTVTTMGGSDAFTAKLDKHGAVLWVRTVGGPQADCGNEICADRDDNVLVVGNTYGGMKAGAKEWPHAGGMDCFVLKYSAAGELLWSVPIKGAGNEQGRGITTDAGGNVLVAGEFTGTIHIEDSALTAASGQRDIFVVRLSPAGRLLWAKRFGAGGDDYARGVGCDGSGNIWVTGVFSGQVSFGQETLQAGGGENLFLLKLSPAGDVVWVRGMTGSGQGHGCEIEVTADGCAVLSGDVMGSLSIVGKTIETASRREVFVARFDAGGRLDWVKPIHGTGAAANFAIALDPSGRVTVAGSFTGTLEADDRQLKSGAEMESFVIAMERSPAAGPAGDRGSHEKTSRLRGQTRAGLAARGDAQKRPADATHTGDGQHKVREIEFAIPAERWQKEMAVRVYFPERGGPWPLIVFCAGSGGGNDTFAETSISLASHGYVVLHTSYPFESRRDAKGNEGLTTQRVADISLALDSLEKMAALKPELKGKIDATRIGAMGHSSGAYITQLIGGATVVFNGKEASFRDPRVKAIIQYSGQGSNQQGLTKDSWKNLTIPMLTFTGTKDRGATGGGPEWKKEPFDLSPAGNKFHVCYEGGHHGSFSGKFARDPQGKAIFDHAQRLSLVFWNAYLNGDQQSLKVLKSQEPSRWNNARLEYFCR
jgi:dienelactone hydrolase